MCAVLPTKARSERATRPIRRRRSRMPTSWLRDRRVPAQRHHERATGTTMSAWAPQRGGPRCAPTWTLAHHVHARRGAATHAPARRAPPRRRRHARQRDLRAGVRAVPRRPRAPAGPTCTSATRSCSPARATASCAMPSATVARARACRAFRATLGRGRDRRRGRAAAQLAVRGTHRAEAPHASEPPAAPRARPGAAQPQGTEPARLQPRIRRPPRPTPQGAARSPRQHGAARRARPLRLHERAHRGRRERTLLRSRPLLSRRSPRTRGSSATARARTPSPDSSPKKLVRQGIRQSHRPRRGLGFWRSKKYETHTGADP